MVEISTFFLLAFAVSLDSFMVGFTYGLRKMKLPLLSITIIGFVSFIVFFMSMMIGDFIASFMSPSIAEMFGGIILIIIGLWIIYQFFKTDNSSNHNDPIMLNFEIKTLGIVIQILRKPMTADMDRSGTISGLEAFFLGLALSVDSLGAGVGAAMLDFTPVFAAVAIGCTTSIFLAGGLKSGLLFSYWQWLQRLTFLPGIILILIGIFKMT